jgi:hypothetical protein
MTTETNPIPDMLRREVAQWAPLAHHALLQRYLLARGTECIAQALPKKYGRGQKRECFRNAIRLAKRNPNTLRYVEGYALGSALPILIHHAWVIDAEDRVIDVTWDEPETCHYFGRVFTVAEWKRETDRTGTMSMLDGVGLNHVLMFEDVPGLEDEIRALRAAKVAA